MGDRDKLYERKCDYCYGVLGWHARGSKVCSELNFDVLLVLMAFDRIESWRLAGVIIYAIYRNKEIK